jgi:adenosylmethionine-8-amino-7-oxononanoate aminotransferase
MWGIDNWQVSPDIIATAKGMTAGYTPLSAVIARDDIWGVLEKNHSPFKAGHTLNANAVSCAGAIAVIHYALDNHLIENSAERGKQALAGMQKIMDKHPTIGRISGKGLMFGFEFVKNRATKEPFAASNKVSSVLEWVALERGLVTYPCTGTIDGVGGDMVLMAPPLVISEKQIEDILSILDESIAEVEQRLEILG